MPEFLAELLPRPFRLSKAHGLEAGELYLGKGSNALEVAVARSARPPARTAVLEAWKERRGGRAAPLVLVALRDDTGTLCGPTGATPPVHGRVNIGQVERLCREALSQPDRHAALRFLAQALPSLETALPGIKLAL